MKDTSFVSLYYDLYFDAILPPEPRLVYYKVAPWVDVTDISLQHGDNGPPRYRRLKVGRLQSSTAAFHRKGYYPERMPFYEDRLLAESDDRPKWQQAKEPNEAPRKRNGMIVRSSGYV